MCSLDEVEHFGSSMNIETYDWPTMHYSVTFYQPPSLIEVLSTNSSGILQSALYWPLLNNGFPLAGNCQSRCNILCNHLSPVARAHGVTSPTNRS